MTTPQLEVSQYTLCLDARDTVQVALEAGHTGSPARALAEALRAATTSDRAFATWQADTGPKAVMAAGPATGAADLALLRLLPEDADWVEVTAVDVDGALDALAGEGLLATVTLWRETSGSPSADGRRRVSRWHTVRPLRPVPGRRAQSGLPVWHR